MRIFVTGATGFIGSAVVRDLIDAGHRVIGLARSDAAAKHLITLGAEAHRGDLEDLESLRIGADMSDGVIHTAFIHDFTKFTINCEIDRHAIEALGSALTGSERSLLITSGVGILPASSSLATEDTLPAAGPDAHPRAASEEAAEEMAERGVHVSVIRHAPSVHGRGEHGFVPILIGIAREKGVSAYVGDGENRWPAVHRLDAARIYRLALEKGAAKARYHSVAEEGVPFREIAEVIGKQLGVPVVSMEPEQAAGHFTWFTHFVLMDVTASSRQTREQLGWRPREADLLTDLRESWYFV